MTNSNLIAVFSGSISNQTIQLTNARELHSFLESNQDFSNWISNRISEYGFVQDEDYITLEIKTRGRPRKEYHITLDMGKELAMVERNEKGRQIRKYFIECERQVLQNNQQIAPLVQAEKFIDIRISESNLQELAWVWFAGQQMADFISNLIRPLELLGSSDAPRAYSYANEYGNLLSGSIDLIEQLTKGIHFDNPTPLKRLKQAKEYREHRRQMVLNSREMVERVTAKHRLAQR